MRKSYKRTLAVVLLMGMIFTSPSVALAATESASSMDELLEIVTSHALKRESKFKVKYTGSQKDVDSLFEDDSTFFDSDLSMYDDPSTSDDADYIVGNLNLSSSNDYLTADGKKLEFNLRYYETSKQTEYVNEHVPQILSKLGVGSMSNYKKVLKIHDYVCNLITYSNTEKDEESTVYGAITTGKALCNSYALCMYKLLVEANVPCKFVAGMAGTGRDADAHAWNIVALGDKWYLLDATWDDPDDELTHNYFLKGSSDFDSYDPSEPHKLFDSYGKGAFAKAFPIAKTAFKKGMDDENVSVKIGDGRNGSEVNPSDPTDPDGPGVDPADPDEPESYTFGDIVYGKYPSNGKFTVKKGKTKDLMLYIDDDMYELIKKATYKVTTGKSRVKVSFCELDKDKDGSYVWLYFKGKKKGKVNIKLTLKLTNGQSLSYTFKGKVK